MKAIAMTDVGQKRHTNQDYVYASPTPVGKMPNLFIVADGMGGHKAGDYASRFVVESLVSFLKTSEDPNSVSAINKGIQVVNKSLLDESLHHEELSGMGTTLVVSFVRDNTLYVANIGDSRLYIVNHGIQQITRDHSLVEEMVSRGELSRDSINYQSRKNIITRAIGVSSSVEADFFEIELQIGDYILMCSDGLTNMVDDDSISRIVQGPGTVKDKADRLIQTANDNGGKDNIAVILIDSEVSEVSTC